MPPRNVIMFIVDGLRTDALGCYGHSLPRTPHVDSFARDGVRFRQAYCPHSVCMPTRATLFTGRYPHAHGVWANGVPLPRSEVTLAAVLRDAGYATCASGKVHFEPQQPYANGIAPLIRGPEPYYGFQEVHLSENLLGAEYLQFIDEHHPELATRARQRADMPEATHELQWITDQALDFITRSGAAGTPFLCACSYHELSPPCTPPPTYRGLFCPADMPVPDLRADDLAARPPFYRLCYEGYVRCGRQPDEATLRASIASYHSQMAFIDYQFGRVTETLRRLGLWDHTLVLFTADHGLSLNDHWQWRHGPFLFDQVVNIPMIWSVPGRQRTGGSVEELVEGVDVMPTILDWCGVPPPAGVQGVSLGGLIAGDPHARGKQSVLLQERHAPDLAARGIDPTAVNQVGIRTHDWKLIHYHDAPWGELYDLTNDPGEFRNLWAEARYVARRRELEALLLDRLVGAQDPLPTRSADW